MSATSFSKKELWGHPVGLYVLSATEMWERLSYYGMAAILALYLMTPETLQAMGWQNLSDGDAKKNAFAVVGWYLMFVYLTPMIGGYVADRFWGQRKSILVGGLMMMIGKFLLATPFMMIEGIEPFFIWSGIAFSVLGNGFFKPNISTIVGDLYAQDDPRRDSAFTIFYMGINCGACIAFLLVGWIGEMVSYQLAFFVTGIGMALGILIQILFAQKTLGDLGKAPKHKLQISIWEKIKLILQFSIVVLFLFSIYLLSTDTILFFTINNIIYDLSWSRIILIIGFVSFCIRFKQIKYFILFVIKNRKLPDINIFDSNITLQEKLQIGTILFFSSLSIIFWMGFEQSTGSLTFFAKEQTDLVVLGYEMPASWLRAVNPFFIFLMAPIISMIWLRMGKKQPDALGKYAYGFLMLGITFLIPAFGASLIEVGEKAHIMWLIMTYFVMTISEICISPVGLSVVSYYSPARFLGLMMGIWFLSAGLGGKISGWVGSFIVDFGYVTVFFGTSIFCFFVFLAIMVTRPLYKPLLEARSCL